MRSRAGSFVLAVLFALPAALLAPSGNRLVVGAALGARALSATAPGVRASRPPVAALTLSATVPAMRESTDGSRSP